MATIDQHLPVFFSSSARAGRGTVTMFALVILAAWGLLDAPRVSGAQQVPPENDVVSRPVDDPEDRLVIGPGKVRFAQTRTGRWIEFTPNWGDGQSLIATGGFAVYADAVDGSVTELINTSADGVNLSDYARKPPKCREGMARGSRAPSLEPDDDHDGRVNEDWLDGADNDHDGLVDEDFAAIGDEMVVTDYYGRQQNGRYRVDAHEEAYAWSLPNVDGVVMLSLRIRSNQPLENVRIVAYYERAGAHELEEASVEARTERRRTRSSTLVSTNGNGASLALIPWPSTGEESDWTHGFVETNEDLSTAVVRAIGKTGERRAQAVTDVRGAGPGAFVYHISPAVRKLDAGEEVRIDCALVAAPSRTLFDEAATSALVTYLGDGVNRYVPPPLAMTPRLIWGSYHAVPDEHEAIAFRLDPIGEESVAADRISYFSGVDPFALEKRMDSSSEATWTLRGDIASDMLKNKDRMTLKGRLDSGEFFELILRPEEESLAGISDEMFWKTPGKLEQELVSGSPNPFRNSTTVFYEIPSEVTLEDGSSLRSLGPYETSVKVYSVSGRLVNTLVEGRFFPGLYSVDWPAVDERGSAVASGVYYVKLQVEKKFITRRLILLK